MNFYYDQEVILEFLWLAAEGDEELSFLLQLEDFHESFHNSIIVCGACHRVEGDRD